MQFNISASRSQTVTQQITQIIYVSHSIHPIGHKCDMDILTASTLRNSTYDITGCLLRASNDYYQIIEGSHAAVTAVFRMIERDRRHDNVLSWVQTRQQARRFPGWSMRGAHLTQKAQKRMRAVFEEGDVEFGARMDAIAFHAERAEVMQIRRR